MFFSKWKISYGGVFYVTFIFLLETSTEYMIFDDVDRAGEHFGKTTETSELKTTFPLLVESTMVSLMNKHHQTWCGNCKKGDHF